MISRTEIDELYDNVVFKGKDVKKEVRFILNVNDISDDLRTVNENVLYEIYSLLDKDFCSTTDHEKIKNTLFWLFVDNFYLGEEE